MIVREIKFKDFSQIHNLQKKYNLRSIINYKDKILKNYKYFSKKIPMGWVIEDHGKVKGCVVNIVKTYCYNHKKILCSASNSLVVDEKYRSYTLNLLRKFFNQKKIDFFLNTTPNEATYKIWKKIGSHDIPQETLYKKLLYIFNSKKTLSFFFKRNKIIAPNFFLNVSSNILRKSLIKKKIFDSTSKLKFKRTLKLNKELKFFLKSNLNKNKLELNRDKSWFELNYNNRKIQKSYLFEVRRKNKIIGFCGLIENNIKKFNLKRLSLCDIIIEKNNPKIYEFLLFKLFNMSEIKKYDLIETQGFTNGKHNILKKFAHLSLKNKHYPFLYKVKSPSSNIFLKKKGIWKLSLVDGDNLI